MKVINTVKEGHIFFDTLVQESNSEIKRTILPQQKDMYFNMSLFGWINHVMSKKTNIKHEGLDGSVKRIDELKNLESATGSLPMYKYDERSIFCNLPSNYLHYVGSVISTTKSCTSNAMPTPTACTTLFVVLPLSEVQVLSYDFLLDIRVGATTTNVITAATFNGNFPIHFNRMDSAFIPIRFILDYCNSLGLNYEFYYEQYGDKYYHNSIIIVSKNGAGLDTASLSYKGVTGTAVNSGSVASQLLYSGNVQYGTVVNSICNKPGTLVSSENINIILAHPIYVRNMQDSPYATLTDNKIIIYHDGKFKVNDVKLNYKRFPRLYNITTGMMPEIDCHEEIITKAVALYLGSLGDPTNKIHEDISLIQ